MERETSLKCYDKIKEEGNYDTDMEMIYDAITRHPLMTGREYAQVILGYDDMNKVRPRITDLKNDGAIIEIGKRLCSCSNIKSYVWGTLEGIEKLILKKLKFNETQANLFTCREGEIICFQDFRRGSRKSYALLGDGTNVNYKTLTCYINFKKELDKILKNKDE